MAVATVSFVSGFLAPEKVSLHVRVAGACVHGRKLQLRRVRAFC